MWGLFMLNAQTIRLDRLIAHWKEKVDFEIGGTKLQAAMSLWQKVSTDTSFVHNYREFSINDKLWNWR